MCPSLVVAVAAALVTPGPDAAAVLERDRRFLQGHWKIVRFDADADRAVRAGADGTRYTVTGDRLSRDYSKYAAIIRLDVGHDPSWIDLITPADGPDPVIVRGIYEVSRERLRICHTGGGNGPARSR